ncbi:hypothetical protein ACRRTK_018749 [Alexandromys fortis]
MSNCFCVLIHPQEGCLDMKKKASLCACSCFFSVTVGKQAGPESDSSRLQS